jgi:hypothetical protein
MIERQVLADSSLSLGACLSGKDLNVDKPKMDAASSASGTPS